MYIGPLVFKALFLEKSWGGRAMARYAGKALPPNRTFGESWEVADHAHGTSVVRCGPLAGKSLQALMRRYSREIVGRRFKGRFPLLLKVIDAKEKLSVQVHPDDRCVRAMRLNESGKTEAWYLLWAGPKGRIISGLRTEKDIPHLRGLAESGKIGERLRSMIPKKGDAFLCEAGAVHSLGPSICLLEVQQNSDATFRLYDWGRVGLDGRPRPLHINEAIHAIGKKVVAAVKSRPRRLNRLPFPAARLVACDYFVMDRWNLRKPFRRSPGKRFEILYVVSGRAVLRVPEWPTIALMRGTSVLIPACVDQYDIVSRRPLEVIRVAEPE